jgi:hypothetical protein
MKLILTATTVAALTLGIYGQAQASKLCKLTGTYTDEYGVATAMIKKLRGTLSAPPVCATPYSFGITDLTKTGFTVTGKNKTKSCGKFSAGLTFMGSCSVFGGTVNIGGQQLSDVFTKQPDAARHSAAPDMGLTKGFK